MVLTGIAVYVVINNDTQDTRSSADNPNGSINLSPALITADNGEQFNVEIRVNPDNANSGSAMAVDAVIKYDRTKVQATQVTNGAIAGTYPYEGNSGITHNNGTVRVSWVGFRNNETAPPITSNQLLATVRFTVLAEGENEIKTEFTSTGSTVDSNIVRNNNGTAQDILGASSTVTVNDGEGEPDPPPPDPGDLLGDLNQDGKISLSDYSLFLQDYRECRNKNFTDCNARSDLNDDDKVSLGDYAIFIREYKAYKAAHPNG